METVRVGDTEAGTDVTGTPVTTVPRVCPICLKLISSETLITEALEFADFPGVTYHAACVESIGVDRVRAVLADNWPPPPLPAEIVAQAAEEAADEATDAPDTEAPEAVADDESE